MIRKVIGLVRGNSAGGEAVRYLIAGATTTLIDFSMFALMSQVIGIGVAASNATAISTAILFAYVVNKLFVFRRHSDTKKALAFEFAKFIAARLFTMALDMSVVLTVSSVLGYHELLGKVSAQVLVIITNFFISKLIVFRRQA